MDKRSRAWFRRLRKHYRMGAHAEGEYYWRQARFLEEIVRQGKPIRLNRAHRMAIRIWHTMEADAASAIRNARSDERVSAHTKYARNQGRN